MNIREIKTPITAATLNESLAKRYGTKIDIAKFSLPQLEDARNKIRTMLKELKQTKVLMLSKKKVTPNKIVSDTQTPIKEAFHCRRRR